MESNITITDVTSLWGSFCQTAHFHDSDYDAALEREIRNALKLPATGQMSSLLETNAVSIEDLLFAILNAMQPFSQMLNDLLRMFEQASIQYGNVNLKIQFDFDAAAQPFQFDLNHFRQTVRSSKMSKKIVSLISDPHKLVDAFDVFGCHRFCNRPRPASPSARRWLDEYENDTWPDFLPEIPITGIESLDKKVEQLWTMVANAIDYYKQAYDPDKGRKRSHSNARTPGYRDPLWQAETDCWVGYFFRVATYTLERLGELAPEEKAAEAQRLEARLLPHIHTKKNIEIIVACLEDILSLPFWKKRHELYAAWVLAQIVDSLKDTGVQFHAPDNTLSFSFSATRMATCTKLKPALDIWAELRTEHSSMVSKKRKNHIQPDYTLAIHDPKDINNTVAVIECKQYKRANRRNFLEAITDYAGGRPKAQIFLVNYGSISQKLLDKLKVPSGRSFPFGDVRPGSAAAQEFREKLLSEVLEYYRKNFEKNHLFMCPWSNMDTECSIQLTWSKVPKDLDLHLQISESGGKTYAVSFSSPGDTGVIPYAQLDQDCRSGDGCETIHIGRWLDAEYDIAINNFSGESEIDGTINIRISCGSDQYICSCKKPWCPPFVWHVFRLNSCGFQVIDRCIRRVP